MKKKFFGLLILIAGLLFYESNAYAAGNLIVDGQVQASQLQVTGQVSVYELPSGCSALTGLSLGPILTTSSTCYTQLCSSDPDRYYNCSGECNAYDSVQCNGVYKGKVYP